MILKTTTKRKFTDKESSENISRMQQLLSEEFDRQAKERSRNLAVQITEKKQLAKKPK